MEIRLSLGTEFGLGIRIRVRFRYKKTIRNGLHVDSGLQLALSNDEHKP